MMEVIVDVINDAVETLTEAEIARAKAQMKTGEEALDNAGKLFISAPSSWRITMCAYSRAADGGRAGGADHDAIGDGIDHQRRARACCCPQPIRRSWRNSGRGSGHGGGFAEEGLTRSGRRRCCIEGCSLRAEV
jgi:hypothetical protein